MAYLKKISNDNNVNGDDTARVDESVVDAQFKENNSRFDKKKVIGGIGALVLLLIIGFSVYAYWSWNGNGDGTPGVDLGLDRPVDPQEAINEEKDPSLNEGEKTVASPINGVLYTEKRAKFWESRRPLAVVIENHVASRPPYGLSDAEVVYESVAEGGITRFVAVYLANQAPRLEPIRSIRNYFLHWSSDFNAILVHHGGANSEDERTDALGNIERYKIDDLDCIQGGDFCTRDQERFAPHNSMSNTAVLWQEASKRKINKPVDIKPWQFKDDAPEADRPLTQNISYNFWDDPDYLVRLEYDPKTNSYLRFNGNLYTDQHIDANYNEQIAIKNVVIQEMEQGVVDDGTPYPHLVYETIGTGNASIFMDGKQVAATWEKADRNTKVVFYDAATGDEIKFNRGLVWISVVPPANPLIVN